MSTEEKAQIGETLLFATDEMQKDFINKIGIALFLIIVFGIAGALMIVDIMKG